MMFEKKRPVITKQNEAHVERMIEQDFASHRECLPGRNFLALVMRHHDNGDYRAKFDKTFRGSPGTKEWWDERFCPICDRLKTRCICGQGIEPEVDENPFIGYHTGRMR